MISGIKKLLDLWQRYKIWKIVRQSKKFAEELIEEVVSFPNGDYDDFCDSMTLALMRFRQGRFISLAGEDEMSEDRYLKKREYY